MRIAVWHNLPSGGGKRALYYHIRGLLERGHTVKVWCPSTADQRYLPLGDLVVEHVLPLDVGAQRAGKGWVSEARALSRKVRTLKAMDEHCQRAAEEISHGGFDMLFANACMFFRAPPIGRYVTIPRVLYLQEPYRWLYEALPRLPWIAPAAAPSGRWWSPVYLASLSRDSPRLST